MPERDTFRIEDLSFIISTRIQINELGLEEIKKIANKVNKLRLKGVDDDDIVLEIQRSFQSGIHNVSNDLNQLTAAKNSLEFENQRVSNISGNLEKQLYKSQYHTLILSMRKHVIFNWLKIIVLFAVSVSLIYYAIKFTPVENKYIQLMVSAFMGLALTYLTNLLAFKGKLWITLSDKEFARQETIKFILNVKQNN